MRIVIICEFYQPYLGFQENNLVKYYVKHGHEVCVVTSPYGSVFDYYYGEPDPSLAGVYEVEESVHIFRMGFAFNRLRVKAYTSIRRILEWFAPDLIFVHDIIPNLVECAQYKREHPGCGLILDYHADYSNSGKNWLSIHVLHRLIRGRFFLNRALADIDRIFPVVPTGFTFLNEVYGIPLDRMELLPLGTDVDTAQTVQEEGRGTLVRSRLGIPRDHSVIFTGGKLEPRKRTNVLLEAHRRLEDERVHVIVAGESAPSHRDFYETELAGPYGECEAVHFVGWLDAVEIFEHMDASDIAVFPASQSVMWQQSISMGLPLVVGNTGGQSVDYLNQHGNIIEVAAEDIHPGRFTEVIRDVLADDDRRADMASGARAVTSEMLDWNALIEKTLVYARAPQDRIH